MIFADFGSQYGLLGMDCLEQCDCVRHCSLVSLEAAGHEVQLHKLKPAPCCLVDLVDEVIMESAPVRRLMGD